MATIEIIIGSMFSGKSTELLRRCRTYSAIDKNVLVINHSIDTRCQWNEAKTHDNITIKALKTNDLMSLDIDTNVDIIAIDEAQFFDNLFNFIKSIESRKVVIIIAGLDGDYNRSKFGEILDCIPLCNSVTKLSAMCSICRDGTSGSFSKRISINDDKIFVGSNKDYISVCRRHLFTPSSDCHNLNK